MVQGGILEGGGEGRLRFHSVLHSVPSHKDFTVVHGHIMNLMRPYRCPWALNVLPRPFTSPLKQLVCDP